MDYRNNKHTDTWDEGVFGTGNTSPPKSRSGIIALLVILVIFLSGTVSLLSFMNIKLFRELSQQKEQLEQYAPMSFSELEKGPPATEAPAAGLQPEQHLQEDVSISLNRSPQSVDNIPETGALSWQEIYEKNISSVAEIVSTGENGTLSGSGIVVSSRGFILTTYYMVGNAETIQVNLSDGRSFSAVVVGADQLTDLAIVYVDAPELVSAEFGDSDALRVGDSVAVLGSQMDGSLNNGIISAIKRDVPFLGLNVSLIQSNVLLSPGSSGGPLINCYGQVIGIHTTTIVPEENTGDVGLAIPSTTILQVANELISQGYVSGRPTLGLTGESITRFDQYYFHIPEGLYLNAVNPDSDAFAQGLEPGDILLALDGQPITSQNQLNTLVNSHAIGDVLTALVYRGGEEETITLTVTEYTG